MQISLIQVTQMGECEKIHLPEAECNYSYFLLCRTSTEQEKLVLEKEQRNRIANTFELPTPILYVHLLYIGDSNQEKRKRKKDSFFLSRPSWKSVSVEPTLGVKKRTRLSERSEGVCSF